MDSSDIENPHRSKCSKKNTQPKLAGYRIKFNFCVY